MTITTEQQDALVEALERGGETDKTTLLPGWSWRLQGPDEYPLLTPAGRIIARLFKDQKMERALYAELYEFARSRMVMGMLDRFPKDLNDD